MNSRRQELDALTRDARLFVQSLIKGKRPSTVSPRAVPQPQKQLASPPVVVKAVVEKPQAPAPAPSPSPSVNWELQPMAQASFFTAFRASLGQDSKLLDPPLDVLLILPEENGSHRLFLENVARAITRSFASAVVMVNQEGIFQKTGCRLVLAPVDLLKKKFPHAEPHQPIRGGGKSWIPLEQLDLYSHDVNSKRTLWMTIQRSFQSS